MLQFLDSSSFHISEISAFILVVVITWLGWRLFTTPANIPPGPRGLPIVGYLPFLQEKGHEQFNELSKTYGEIFSLHLGTRLVIVLNSYEAIKEAFVKQSDIFAGRHSQFLEKNEVPTIFSAEGEVWKDYKRFTLSTLRNFGLGKSSVEPRIKEEIYYLLEMIKNLKEKPTDIGDMIRMSISNVICTIKYGHRFDYEDENFQYLSKILSIHISRLNPLTYRLMFPFIAKLPILKTYFERKTARETHNLLMEDIRKKVQQRADKYIPGSDNDFVSAWFTEAARRGKENGKNFTNEHLSRVIESLFIAGSDTTANTLRWGILYLMEYVDVQSRVQKEIDDIIGYERMPSITDKDHMPYTEATTMEIQRISTLVPLAIAHCNTEATTLMNFHIPKRSSIFPNLWAVHHDPKTYPEPEIFRPERFLDENGSKVIKAEKLIPFSLGKRQCLGESLAKAELFLYFTSLLQKFTFRKAEEDELSFDYDMSTVSVPKPYRTIASLRKAPTRS